MSIRAFAVAGAVPLLLVVSAAPAVGRAPAAWAALQSSQPGAWVAPLSGPLEVTRPFRSPAVRWGAGHRGVDLAGAARRAVRTAGAGRVSYAGRLAGRGVVAIVHGALRTTYEPVDASVRVGDIVARGAPLGRLTPGHDPARPARYVLHWGLRRGATYLDPMSLLGSRRVRLLPRWGVEPGSGRGPPAPPGSAGTVASARAAGGVSPSPAGRRESSRRPHSARTAVSAIAAAAAIAGAALLTGRRRRPSAGERSSLPP